MRSDRLYIQGVVRSIEKRIRLTKLDLTGLTVLTEAATGAYAVTPVIAAMAGAREVVAFTKNSRFGSVEDVIKETNLWIRAVKESLPPVNIISSILLEDYSRFDIITNSGHLRPITREQIMSMKSTAVIPLMYESWELRKSDIDLAACEERAIKTAGTNEHNRLLNVFEFLGPLVVQALHNAFVPVVDSRIAVVSNNAFGIPVSRHLARNRADVHFVGDRESCPEVDGVVYCGDLSSAELEDRFDACVIATTPSISYENTYDRQSVTGFISKLSPATCVHLWGDVDYDVLRQSDIVLVPSEPVPEGHQGLVMSGAGVEPVVRLIVGGLKVAEVLARGYRDPFNLDFCQMLP